MPQAVWSRLAQFYARVTGNSGSPEIGHRRAASSPVGLERLEDRTVPSTTFNVLGPASNLTNNFNLPTSGLVVAPEPGQAVGNSAFPNSGFSVLGGQSSSGNLLIGAAAVNSLGLADASVRLFASSAVNSIGLFNQVVPTFIPSAYGFGSGTQPGMPWAPAAYNLGLANQQTGYPSMADQGFQATPPWARNLTHKRIRETPPVDEMPETLTQEVTRIANRDNNLPPRTYRMVTPEQVLDEVDRIERPGDENQVAEGYFHDLDQEAAANPVGNLPSPLLRGARTHSPDQDQARTLPASRQGYALPVQHDATHRQAGFPTESSERLNAADRVDFSETTRDNGQAGLLNLDGENRVADLDSVSLTEFPTLSRMLLVPSLSALLMEFPLPVLRLDSRGDQGDSTRTALPLAIDPDLPFPPE